MNVLRPNQYNAKKNKAVKGLGKTSPPKQMKASSSTSYSTTGNSNPPIVSIVFCPRCLGKFTVEQLKVHMPPCQGRICPKCRGNFYADELELHRPICGQSQSPWGFGDAGHAQTK